MVILKRAIAAMLIAVGGLIVILAAPGVAGAGRETSSNVAQGSGRDETEPPSAIEDIPVDGLLFTLAIAAFIGAAGGKIFVSLSGDGS